MALGVLFAAPLIALACAGLISLLVAACRWDLDRDGPGGPKG